MLTVVLILFPIFTAIACAFLPQTSARAIAIGSTLVSLGITVAAAATGLGSNVLYDTNWIPNMGIRFTVGMDGLAWAMVFLTNALLPLILLSANNKNYNNRFYGLALLMQGALVGVFTALDGFLFYIFWELALIPIYFICLIWGDEGRQRITLKFFIYTLAGSLVMLLGFIYLYLQTPAPHSFSWTSLVQTAQTLSANEQSLLFWALFLAFAIKIPIIPFHTWQPDTYVNAPTQGTMLLSGIMLKMGIYGLMRWLLPLAPLGVAQWGHLAMVLCVIGIIYGSVIALRQKDIKRLVAYSSIAHVGLIAAGVFTQTEMGEKGAILQMLAHGFNVVALFYIIDLIQAKAGTRDIAKLGGIALKDRKFAVLSFIAILGAIAMPLTNAFVGEFMLLAAVFSYQPILGVTAGLTIILGAAYMLRFYKKTMFGEEREIGYSSPIFADNTAVLVLGILSAIVIIMGIFPKPVFDILAASILK